MAYNDIVLRAILALDAYNRGEGAKVSVDGYQIGNASLGLNSNNYLYPSTFFAQTYTLDGKTIISYRGTDGYFTDITTGWPTGVGSPDTSQASLAVKFYKEIAGNIDPRSANIELTGHSLGGGLAGYVGSLYNKSTTIFDNMPFELAALNAHAHALNHYNNTPYRTADEQYRDEALYNSIYANSTLDSPIYGSPSFISAYAASGEVCAAIRGFQETPVNTIEDDILNPLHSHDQALLTILLYGETEPVEWKDFRPHLTPHLFNTSVASATHASAIINNNTSVDTAMRHAIAYSAIGQGASPFGKSGIRALFNDATDIGKILIESPSTILSTSKDHIGKAIVQFAGQVAVGKITDELIENGILTNSKDEATLILDLSDTLWANNSENSTPNIIAENDLKAIYFSMMGNALYGAMPFDIATGMNKLWGTYNSSIIDRLVYQVNDGSISTTIDERTYESNDVTLFAASSSNSVDVIGHTGDDLLYGSVGDDTFYGGAGKDLLRGGSGNDSIDGGTNDDYLLGGDGDDILIDTNGNNTLDGGAGNDHLKGGEGLNTLIGGAGNDTFEGGMGTLIQAIDDEKDVIHFSHGIGVEADSEDEIHFHGRILHGGLAHGNEVSDAAMAYDANGLIRYSMNHVGELIVENVLGWKMFIKDYVGGPGVTNPTAGINVAQITWSAYRLLDYDERVCENNVIESVGMVLDWGWKTLLGKPRPGATDPLVLDLDGDGLELTSLSTGTSPFFDMDNDNFAEATGWVRGDDGILVNDINGDGQITSIAELFGDATVSGFDALTSFDSNSDGIIDATDTNFSSIKIWRDFNGDAITDSGELFSLTEVSIQSINLTDVVSGTTNVGHTIVSTGSFTRTDGTTGEIADVNFLNNNFSTKYMGDSTVSAAATALPDLKGYGVLTSLRIAMTNDAALLTAAQTAAQSAPTTLEGIRQMITPVMRAWAAGHNSGVEDIHYLYTTNENSSIEIRDMAIHDPSTGAWSLSSGVDIVDANGVIIAAPTLADIMAMPCSIPGAAWDTFASSDIAFLEQYLGEDLPITAQSLARTDAASAIEKYLEMLYDFQNSLGVAFAVQGGLSGFFQDVVYDVETGLYSSTAQMQLTPVFTNILTASPQSELGGTPYLILPSPYSIPSTPISFVYSTKKGLEGKPSKPL